MLLSSDSVRVTTGVQRSWDRERSPHKLGPPATLTHAPPAAAGVAPSEIAEIAEIAARSAIGRWKMELLVCGREVRLTVSAPMKRVDGPMAKVG